MNQILLHNGNNDYKLPHIGELKKEKAVGHNISMRLPCRALIDDGALDCYYITTFLSNGKFIVVLTTSLCLRCPSSSFVVHHVVAVTVAVAVTIAVVHCAIAVAHNNDVVHPCHCLHLRCRRRLLPSPLSSICTISVAIAIHRCRHHCRRRPLLRPSSLMSCSPVALSQSAFSSSYAACQRTRRHCCLFPLILALS